MSQYEYRVISAPARGLKNSDAPTRGARFAHALEHAMNAMSREGWEYLRAETLPSIEQTSVNGSATVWRNVLVFRRLRAVAEKRPDVLQLKDPITRKIEAPEPQVVSQSLPDIVAPQHPEDDASHSQGASRMLVDNGVEEWSEVSGLSSSLKQLAENRKKARSGT